MALIDETTQASLRLMDLIRSSRLVNMPTSGDIMKLTQRNTNLCVAIAAMRLLCFTFHAFLGDSNIFRQDVDKEKIESIRKEIINLPEVPKNKAGQNEQQSPGNFSEFNLSQYLKLWGDLFKKSITDLTSEQDSDRDKQTKKDEPMFLQKLLAICCGVISPRSLNGLNHCNLDNDFHIANQEQNISMLAKS